MPLLVICGKPLTGKSHFADIINNFLNIHLPTVIVHADYGDDKMNNKSLISQVEQKLTKQNLVIVDDYNMVKGILKII
jgi:tRNA uridine 5-carbamoylmethylation protein Kti12